MEEWYTSACHRVLQVPFNNHTPLCFTLRVCPCSVSSLPLSLLSLISVSAFWSFLPTTSSEEYYLVHEFYIGPPFRVTPAYLISLLPSILFLISGELKSSHAYQNVSLKLTPNNRGCFSLQKWCLYFLWCEWATFLILHMKTWQPPQGPRHCIRYIFLTRHLDQQWHSEWSLSFCKSGYWSSENSRDYCRFPHFSNSTATLIINVQVSSFYHSVFLTAVYLEFWKITDTQLLPTENYVNPLKWRDNKTVICLSLTQDPWSLSSAHDGLYRSAWTDIWNLKNSQ